MLVSFRKAGCAQALLCQDTATLFRNSGLHSICAPLVSVLAQQYRTLVSLSEKQPKLLVVHPKQKAPAVLQEALRLAESYAGAPCPHIQAGPSKHHHVTPSTYFGPGVINNIQESCAALEPSKLFVNAALSPVQQRNLEVAVGLPVLDRVGLIIDIFAQRARTREARLQVELAALEYRSSRLVRVLDAATGQRLGFGEGGATEVVSARERGRSGSSSGGLGGAGGGGQSELQLQRQRLIARRKALQKKLAEVQRTREVQRAGRRRSGKPVLAVVGYTNAGKSSLLQALTHRDTGVEDKLFATLDPALRRVHLPSGREAILSDTVGFISDLPHQLVNAFKATLEEVREADLLLHVLDASSPDVHHQRTSVLQVLRNLGISEARLQTGLIEVWNKTDLLPSEPTTNSESQADSGAYTGIGLDSTAAAAKSQQEALLSQCQPASQQPNTAFQQKLLSAHQVPDQPQTTNHLSDYLQQDQQSSSDSRLRSNLSHNLYGDFDISDQPAQQHAGPHQASPESNQSKQQQQQQQRQQHQPLPLGSFVSESERPEVHLKSDAQLSPSSMRQDNGQTSRLPVAVSISAVTGAGLHELLLELERKISVKCAARDLADGTARLGPRLLTSTIVGPASKHRRAKWQGRGEWESVLTQSLRDQSTDSASASAWRVPGLGAKDADSWAALLSAALPNKS